MSASLTLPIVLTASVVVLGVLYWLVRRDDLRHGLPPQTDDLAKFEGRVRPTKAPIHRNAR